MGNGIGAVVAVLGLIVGLAMVAVLVSQNAQTASILQALGSSGSSLIGAATAPVTQTSQQG